MISGRWILWGVGAPTPAGMFDAEIGDARVADLIRDHDPRWAGLADGWSMVISADEAEIRAWAERSPNLRGAMPYGEDGAPGPKLELARPY